MRLCGFLPVQRLHAPVLSARLPLGQGQEPERTLEAVNSIPLVGSDLRQDLACRAPCTRSSRRQQIFESCHLLVRPSVADVSAQARPCRDRAAHGFWHGHWAWLLLLGATRTTDADPDFTDRRSQASSKMFFSISSKNDITTSEIVSPFLSTSSLL